MSRYMRSRLLTPSWLLLASLCFAAPTFAASTARHNTRCTGRCGRGP